MHDFTACEISNFTIIYKVYSQNDGKNCAKQGLRNSVVLVLNSKKLILVCSRVVISRSEQNMGMHVNNGPLISRHP